MGNVGASACRLAVSDKVMNLQHRLFHKLYPVMLSLLFTVLLVALSVAFDFSYVISDRSAFLSSSISLGAILIGFTATSQAILMTLPEGGLLLRLRSSGYIKDLVGCFVAAIVGGFVFVVLNLMGFFVAVLNSYFYYCWFFSSFYCVLTFVRLSKLMMLMLKYGAK
jgi:hypothetical protein